jgi:raffinose/stachyose/melibiose transport system substrate-binding protein
MKQRNHQSALGRESWMIERAQIKDVDGQGTESHKLSRLQFLRLAGAGTGIALVPGLLASCAAFTGRGNETSGTISMFVTSEERQALEALIESYKEQNADVNFDVTYAETDQLNTRLRTQLSSGTAADMFRVAPGSGAPTAVQLIAPEFLVNLSDEPWAADIPEGIAPLVQVDGKTYAFPANQTIIATFFNKKVFNDLGIEVPGTWDELLSVCETIKRSGKTPMGLGLSDPPVIQFLSYALVASTVYPDNPDFDEQMQAGNATFVGSGWEEALEKFLELNDREYFNRQPLGTSFDQTLQALGSGETAMVTFVSSTYPVLAEYGGEEEPFGVFATPGVNDASKVWIPSSPIQVYGVNPESEKVDAAKAFIRFLAEPENVTEYAKLSASLPGIRIDQAEGAPILQPLTTYLQEGRSVHSPRTTWPNPEVQQVLMSAGQQLFSGDITIEGLLQRMDEAYQKGKG